MRRKRFDERTIDQRNTSREIADNDIQHIPHLKSYKCTHCKYCGETSVVCKKYLKRVWDARPICVQDNIKAHPPVEHVVVLPPDETVMLEYNWLPTTIGKVK